MSTHHWNPTNPKRRERLVDLAEFRRAAAARAVSQPQTEAQTPQSCEEIPGDEASTASPRTNVSLSRPRADASTSAVFLNQTCDDEGES